MLPVTEMAAKNGENKRRKLLRPVLCKQKQALVWNEWGRSADFSCQGAWKTMLWSTRKLDKRTYVSRLHGQIYLWRKNRRGKLFSLFTLTVKIVKKLSRKTYCSYVPHFRFRRGLCACAVLCFALVLVAIWRTSNAILKFPRILTI